MLFDAIRTMISGGQVNLSSIVAQIISVIFVIIVILPLHEFAHGFVAYKLGDPTAKMAGRLTFNPLASFDPRGALFLLLFGFGWAKPVPVNLYYFKKPKRDMAITALAGPLSNLIAAFVGALLYCASYSFLPANNVFVSFLNTFLNSYIVVNVGIAVFNLLPIPPLDGSRIVSAFLTRSAMEAYYRYQNIIIIMAFVLMISGVLSVPLSYASSFFLDGIINIAALPFRLFGVLT